MSRIKLSELKFTKGVHRNKKLINVVGKHGMYLFHTGHNNKFCITSFSNLLKSSRMCKKVMKDGAHHFRTNRAAFFFIELLINNIITMNNILSDVCNTHVIKIKIKIKNKQNRESNDPLMR